MNVLNTVSARTVLHIAETSWQAAVLAAVVVALGLLLREKLSARWRCALWLVVVARLLMPVAPESPVSLFNLFPVDLTSTTAVNVEENGPAAAETEPRPSGSGALDATDSYNRSLTVAARTDPLGPVDAPPVEPAAAPSPWWTVENVWLALAAAWLLGAGVVLARILVLGVRLRLLLRRCTPVDEAEVRRTFEAACRELGVRRRVDLVASPSALGPAVAGAVRPKMIISNTIVESLSPDELRLVFLHELSHVRRHDLAVQHLWMLTQALHWFNPAVWLSARRWQADRELACDEAVLARLDRPNQAGYGRAILRVMESLASLRPVPGAVGVVTRRGVVARRIMMIARYRPLSRRWTFLAAGLLLLLIPLGLTNAEKTEPRPESAEPRLEKTEPRPSGSGVGEETSRATGSLTVAARKDLLGSDAGRAATARTDDIRLLFGRTDATKEDAAKLLDAITRRLKIAEISLPSAPRIIDDGQVEVLVPVESRDVADRIQRLLTPTGVLEFRILANESDHKDLIGRARKEKGDRVLDERGEWLARWVPVATGHESEFKKDSQMDGRIARRTSTEDGREVLQVLVVNDAQDLTDKHLKSARSENDEQRPAIAVTLTDDGARRMAALTAANQPVPDVARGWRRKLGVLFEGRLFTAPAIITPIGKQGTITGSFTQDEVDDIVALLGTQILRNQAAESNKQTEPRPSDKTEPRPSGSGAGEETSRATGSLTVAAQNGTPAAARNGSPAAADVPKAAETITVAGRCVDESGKPVTQAEAFLYETYPVRGTNRQIARVATDARGQFAFGTVPAPRYDVTRSQTPDSFFYRVLGRKAGLASVERPIDTVRRAKDPLTVTMQPAARLTGRITDERGNPVAGALVSVGYSPVEGFFSARTNDQGEYEIDDLTPMKPQDLDETDGNMHYRMVGPFLVIRHPDFATRKMVVETVPNRIDAQLKPGAAIAGRVLDAAAGKTAAGIVVALEGRLSKDAVWDTDVASAMAPGDRHVYLCDETAVTDSEGRYRVDSLPAGRYNVWVDAKDRTVAAIDSLDVRPGPTVNAPDLRLIAGGFLEGRVVDAATGRPLARKPHEIMAVFVYGPSRPRGGFQPDYTFVDKDGRFRLRLAPGRNYPRLSDPAAWRRTENREKLAEGIEIAEGQATTVEFRVRPQDGEPAGETGPRGTDRPEPRPSGSGASGTSADERDKSRTTETAEANELVRAVLTRSGAVRSGRFEYGVTCGVATKENASIDDRQNFILSGADWRVDYLGLQLQGINYRGRFFEVRRAPQRNGSTHYSLHIEDGRSIEERTPHPPYFAGTLWHRTTIQYVRSHQSEAKLAGNTQIDGIETAILEWKVSKPELSHAFYSILAGGKSVLEEGGVLRLYVAPSLGCALPRIEHVGLDGTVEKRFESTDFTEVRPGLFIPNRCSSQVFEKSGTPGWYNRYEILKMENVNEPIPDEEFVISLPRGASVSDRRASKKADYWLGEPPDGLPEDLTDVIRVEGESPERVTPNS